MAKQETHSTREKILDAAVGVFGRLGYAGATVREICDTAGVNIASINYYFGGKQGLYRELCRSLFQDIFQRYPMVFEAQRGLDPEEGVRQFIQSVMHRLIDTGGLYGSPDKARLVVRELADPSPVLDNIVEEFIRPTAGVLRGLVKEIVGPAATERDVSKCQISIIGQCFYYGLAQPILSRLGILDLAVPGIVDELTDHITRFSLSGMKTLRNRLEKSGPEGFLPAGNGDR